MIKPKVKRKLKCWEVKNEKLNNLILSRGIAYTEVANYCLVSVRAVQRWIYDGKIPKDWNKKRLVELFEASEEELGF